MAWLSPLIAIALTVASGYLLFAASGCDPAETLYQFLIAPIESFYGWTELGVKAAPLVLIATGLAVGFRANVWNIGAEGQLTMGAIAAGAVALGFWGQDGWWILPAMCVAGVLGGMAYAAIPAFLKTRFDVSEILTSLMLTYVAFAAAQLSWCAARGATRMATTSRRPGCSPMPRRCRSWSRAPGCISACWWRWWLRSPPGS